MGEIETGEAMSLQEWLDTILSPKRPGTVITYQFPTDAHRDKYLRSIRRRNASEVKALLRLFLVPAGTLGCDYGNLAWLIHRLKNPEKPIPTGTAPEPTKPGELTRFQAFNGNLSEYQRRLLLAAKTKGKVQPWEGLTWILDLLPHSPKQAIEIVSAFFDVHCGFLPDGRLIGLPDAMAVIRAKYIVQGPPEAGSTLDALTPRQFEALVCVLYRRMGYNAKLTKASADGGRDVQARRQLRGQRETCFIECKHYTHQVGVELVRQLLGVLSHKKVGKGVLATSNHFTRGARALERSNPRLELLDRRILIQLLNEHLGADWPTHIDGEIAGVLSESHKG